MKTLVRQRFFRTLAYTCWTMLALMVVWKGNLDRGMNAGDCVVGIVLFFVGLTAFTYKPTSSLGAAQRAGTAASHSPCQAKTPSL